MLYDNEEYMWFGTEDRMEWIDSPLVGADESSTAWGSEMNLLSGAAFARNSFGSHKTYQFTWADSSSLDFVHKLMSYANGSYGRGMIHFIEPLTYDTNVLPAHVASPGVAVGYDSKSLVNNVAPTSVPVGVSVDSGLPTTSAKYTLSTVGDADSVKTFIPVPAGASIYIGAMYSATGTAGVYVVPVTEAGDGIPVRLTEIAVSSTDYVNAEFTNVIGVRVYIQKTSAVSSTITLTALLARIAQPGLLATPETAPAQKIINTPWIAGQGHTGVRFVGKPSLIAYNGVGGGQFGLSATLKEVDA